MLQLCGDIFLRQRIAHIEAPLQRSVVTLLTYGLALLRLILLDLFRGRDGQITILKAQLNLILLEAGQVNVHFVMVIMLMHIGLHLTGKVPAVELTIHVPERREIEPVIEQILSNNTRHQHNSYLLGCWAAVAATPC